MDIALEEDKIRSIFKYSRTQIKTSADWKDFESLEVTKLNQIKVDHVEY